MPFNDEQLRAQYERAIERSAARLAVLDALPADDPYEDGQILRISRTFRSSKMYTYAALRVDGHWWLTGERYVWYGTDKPAGIVGTAAEWSQLRAWIAESSDPQQLSVVQMQTGAVLV